MRSVLVMALAASALAAPSLVAVRAQAHSPARPAPPTPAPPTPAPPTRRAVLFVAPGEAPSEGFVRAMEAIVAELGDVSARVLVEPPSHPPSGLRDEIDVAAELARAHGAMGSFWLDLTREGDALLYLVDPTGKKVLVRRVRTTPGDNRALFDEIALIARAAVVALLEQREIGPGMDVLPSPAPTEPRPPRPQRERDTPPRRASRPIAPPPSSRRAWLELSYAGGSFAPAVPWLSGARLAARFSPEAWISAGVAYTIAPPIEVTARRATLRLSRHPVEMGLGAAFRPWARSASRLRDLSIEPSLSVLLEILERSTLAIGGGRLPAPPATHVVPAVSASLSFCWSVLTPLSVCAGGGADFFPEHVRFLLPPPSGDLLLATDFVRPRVVAGLRVALF